MEHLIWEIPTLSFLDEVAELAHRRVRNMDETDAKKLGLDIRAGYRLWVDAECVVIHKSHDRSLQYYGGFEYVDSEFRVECGDYVFYTRDGSRVEDAIDRYYGVEKKEEEEDDE